MRNPLILTCLVLASFAHAQTPQRPPLQLRDNDSVVWLGATFLERMQQFSHLETLLYCASSAEGLKFRNLGWSGDEVTGISRAVFGTVEDGFKRLQKDLAIAKPTLVVVQYGAVEAERGEAGEADFAKQLDRLLNEISTSTKARLVLLSPLYRTRPNTTAAKQHSDFVPDPAPYNRSLDRYCEILKEAAASRDIPLIDIRNLSRDIESHNGIVPTDRGYQSLAVPLASKLGVALPPWKVNLDVSNGDHDAHATTVSDLVAGKNEIEFMCRDDHVRPLAAQPRSLTIRGLEPGKYALKVGRRPAGIYTAKQLSEGVHLPPQAGAQPGEQLRRAIIEKNELFFHRHRPQNETYLFLFRKHEQGNNAVEIPQFDPLIEKTEAQIEQLRIPRKQPYVLTRQP